MRPALFPYTLSFLSITFPGETTCAYDSALFFFENYFSFARGASKATPTTYTYVCAPPLKVFVLFVEVCGGRGSTVKGEDGFPPGVLVRPFVRGNVSTEQGREENTLKPPSLSGVHPTLPHTAPPPMQQRGIEAVPRTGEDGGRRRRPRSLPGRKRGGGEVEGEARTQGHGE